MWNGFDGFWQNGVVLETLANWMEYANNTMYAFIQCHRFQYQGLTFSSFLLIYQLLVFFRLQDTNLKDPKLWTLVFVPIFNILPWNHNRFRSRERWSALYMYHSHTNSQHSWLNKGFSVFPHFSILFVLSNYFRYSSVVQGSLRDVYSLLEAYYPQPSFDDMAWYGLSYLRIYEVKLSPASFDL